MKKLFYVFILFIFVSCQKENVLVIDNSLKPTELTITKDTIINDCLDGQGKVLRINDHKITGKGCLNNWIIDAPENQFVIDTSIIIVNCKTYTGVFSAAWVGAIPNQKDNFIYLQRAIDVCLSNGIRNLKIPNGNYNYSQPLNLAKLVGKSYQQVSLHLFGDASFWDTGVGSTLNFTGSNSAAFNMQLNKGSEIDHLRFTGQWKSPTGVDSVYFNLTEAQYQDIGVLHLTDWYRGFCIDAYTPADGSISGSTGNHIHDIFVGGFGRLISMSENDRTFNNDIEIFENIHLGDGKYGIVTSQAQEKGNVFRGVYSWGNLYTLINIGKFGRHQAGNYTFDGGNIAGRCINLIDITQSRWFSSSISNYFCESLKSVGTISTYIPFTIEKSIFDLVPYSSIGQRVVFNSNSTFVKVRDCTLRYYTGSGGEVWVHAPSSNFENLDTYFQTFVYK
jgi:hypothetical protein